MHGSFWYTCAGANRSGAVALARAWPSGVGKTPRARRVAALMHACRMHSGGMPACMLRAACTREGGIVLGRVLRTSLGCQAPLPRNEGTPFRARSGSGMIHAAPQVQGCVLLWDGVGARHSRREAEADAGAPGRAQPAAEAEGEGV